MVSKKHKLRLYSILGICELVLAGLKFGLPKKRSVVMQVFYIWSIRFFFMNLYQNFSSFSLCRCSQTWTFSWTSLWKNVKDGADQDYVIEAFSMMQLGWSTDQNHIFSYFIQFVLPTFQNELDYHASFPVCLAFFPCFQENSAGWWSLSFSDWRRAWIIGCGTSDAVHNETIN